jgi:DNA invertase Pin-like site-specific DNA recombinase
MDIGYARVSTHAPHLALQQATLTQAGCHKVIVGRVSGTVAERPGLATVKERLGRETPWWSGGWIGEGAPSRS